MNSQNESNASSFDQLIVLQNVNYRIQMSNMQMQAIESPSTRFIRHLAFYVVSSSHNKRILTLQPFVHAEMYQRIILRFRCFLGFSLSYTLSLSLIISVSLLFVFSFLAKRKDIFQQIN